MPTRPSTLLTRPSTASTRPFTESSCTSTSSTRPFTVSRCASTVPTRTSALPTRPSTASTRPFTESRCTSTVPTRTSALPTRPSTASILSSTKVSTVFSSFLVGKSPILSSRASRRLSASTCLSMSLLLMASRLNSILFNLTAVILSPVFHSVLL